MANVTDLVRLNLVPPILLILRKCVERLFQKRRLEPTLGSDYYQAPSKSKYAAKMEYMNQKNIIDMAKTKLMYQPPKTLVPGPICTVHISAPSAKNLVVSDVFSLGREMMGMIIV